MIILDHNIVQDSLNDILSKESFIAVDRNDIQRLFGEDPKLRMIRVSANSIDELVPLLKQDLASVGDLPDNCFAAYVGMKLKMSDLELLANAFEPAGRIMRTLISEKSPLGDFVLYYFFK